jgi:hypothetical protein
MKQEYTLVGESNYAGLTSFIKQVNDLLAQGWELHGPTFVLPAATDFGDTYYHQALTRRTAPSLFNDGGPP